MGDQGWWKLIGEDVFEALLEADRDKGERLRFAQNIHSQLSLNDDAKYLSKKTNGQVCSKPHVVDVNWFLVNGNHTHYIPNIQPEVKEWRSPLSIRSASSPLPVCPISEDFNFRTSLAVSPQNFPSLLESGILHTKLWLIDRTHVYVGSANMEWRSLTQAKELGFLVNCSCLADNIAKIYDVYWKLFDDGKVSAIWPVFLLTKFNIDDPMNFTLDDNKYIGHYLRREKRLGSG